jgi:hypothetical protein
LIILATPLQTIRLLTTVKKSREIDLQLKKRHQILFAEILGEVLGATCNKDITVVIEQTDNEERYEIVLLVGCDLFVLIEC